MPKTGFNALCSFSYCSHMDSDGSHFRNNTPFLGGIGL